MGNTTFSISTFTACRMEVFSTKTARHGLPICLICKYGNSTKQGDYKKKYYSKNGLFHVGWRN
jgi:hypothetical protein